jgi:hypothetical protein
VISTTKGRSKEGIVSFKGDGGLVETRIEYSINSEIGVDDLVEIGIKFDSLVKMMKKGIGEIFSETTSKGPS